MNSLEIQSQWWLFNILKERKTHRYSEGNNGSDINGTLHRDSPFHYSNASHRHHAGRFYAPDFSFYSFLIFISISLLHKKRRENEDVTRFSFNLLSTSTWKTWKWARAIKFFLSFWRSKFSQKVHKLIRIKLYSKSNGAIFFFYWSNEVILLLSQI